MIIACLQDVSYDSDIDLVRAAKIAIQSHFLNFFKTSVPTWYNVMLTWYTNIVFFRIQSSQESRIRQVFAQNLSLRCFSTKIFPYILASTLGTWFDPNVALQVMLLGLRCRLIFTQTRDTIQESPAFATRTNGAVELEELVTREVEASEESVLDRICKNVTAVKPR